MRHTLLGMASCALALPLALGVGAADAAGHRREVQGDPGHRGR